MPARFSLKTAVAKAPVQKEATVPQEAPVSKDAAYSLELEHLKEILNKCIQNEEYEKAAELRDKIREIESRRQG